MRKLLGPLIFLIHTPLQILNLAFWASIIILCGLLKLVLPFPAIRTLLIGIMHPAMQAFGACSVLLIKLFNPVTVDVRIDGTLSPRNWYLLISNHLSYLDIVLLINLSKGRIPPPKFFLKKELIWLPFVGLGAWALEMPFMRRYSRSYLEKYPHRKGQDIETTRRSCEKYKAQPTTVINFVEGTRFTAVKHKSKKSQFAHLLPPKAGGIAFTLATMGHLFTNLLDISLLYPGDVKHPMMAMLSGQMRRIIIDVNVLDVPEAVRGDYFSDDAFRGRFQTWLNELWSEKDTRIHQLLEP
ncbi:acyltransferase [Alteromonas confluentis]|uniref:Acyltransferase n=1 Tax=Alteromonas confluentis TaxID=1656094 RepID=A0A1E7Z5H1_9ALTE|nr:acyltransferase [Alteromonas confluentis]OFC68786.1 acyltransferase [Alteromonas confluentis]